MQVITGTVVEGKVVVEGLSLPEGAVMTDFAKIAFMMQMIWWYWVLFGLALLAIEIIIPGGFYILFFGLASLVVGAIVGMGWGGPTWFHWLLFSTLSIGSLLFFRGPLLAKIKSHTPENHPIDTMVGEIAIPLEYFPPNGTGKVELRGTSWTGKSLSSIGIPKGQRSRVERVDGLTLWIKAE